MTRHHRHFEKVGLAHNCVSVKHDNGAKQVFERIGERLEVDTQSLNRVKQCARLAPSLHIQVHTMGVAQQLANRAHRDPVDDEPVSGEERKDSESQEGGPHAEDQDVPLHLLPA